jgi:hypothetical protein
MQRIRVIVEICAGETLGGIAEIAKGLFSCAEQSSCA